MKDKGRTILVAAVLTTVFAGLGTRLVFLHLKPAASTLKRIESGRHLEQKTLGARGRILDRSGNILAVDVAARHVCVDPSFISQHGDMNAVADALSEHLMMDRNEVWELINQPKRRYVRVKTYQRESSIQALKALKLKGIIFEKTSLRNYPKGALGAQVIGFANREGVGSSGIEQSMNTYLKGSSGLRISQKDGRRREIYSRRTVNIEPEAGDDVYLTIDQQVQHFAEKALDDLVDKYEPKAAWALVQNIKTGEILAMASWPTYNPNRFWKAPDEWLRNRTIAYAYEPGSTMKAMVIAAAIDRNVVDANDVFDCEGGRWMYGGRALNDSHGEGWLSVADILKKSSNIGAAKIALLMGDQMLYDGLRAFGFGSRTQVGLPGEDSGIIWNPKRWSKISATRVSMGHEILVTSMQILSSFSAIANGGVQMRPQLIKKVVNVDGAIVAQPLPEEIARPISPETAAEMRRLLARVTQPGGTGTKAALRGYLVAGKTGTAQKVDLENGGYYASKYIASFAGFLPVENPAISIMVVADDPQKSHYGGTVCGPAFKAIADQTVRYMTITPQGFPPDYMDEEDRGIDSIEGLRRL